MQNHLIFWKFLIQNAHRYNPEYIHNIYQNNSKKTKQNSVTNTARESYDKGQKKNNDTHSSTTLHNTRHINSVKNEFDR